MQKWRKNIQKIMLFICFEKRSKIDPAYRYFS